MRLDDQVVLAAGLSPVGRGLPGSRAALHRMQVRRVHGGAGEVEHAGRTQLGQQQLVQSLPDPDLVPLRQPPPTRHPRSETQLRRQNKTPKIRTRAAKHHVELYLTPTSESWANPIESQFGPLQTFTTGNSTP